MNRLAHLIPPVRHRAKILLLRAEIARWRRIIRALLLGERGA